jgi:hypothetical protein
MELDDNVSGVLMVSKPFAEHRELCWAKRAFVVSAIKRLVEFYWISWLLGFPASKAIFKIDQTGTLSSLRKNSPLQSSQENVFH